MSLLAASQLAVSIGTVNVCRDLDLQIVSGDCWCILGRNGTGKTTLLHTLAGLRAPAAGSVKFNKRTLANLPRKAIARHIGILFQDHRDAFPANVLETVLTGRHPWLGTLQWEGGTDLMIARRALHAVGLENMEQRIVTTLSGGERRRLGIATLLTQEPQLLCLDEPTNHLDIHHQIRMLDLVQQQTHRHGRALLLVMHDLNLALRYCNQFLLLYGDGETAQGPAEQVLTQANLERLYHYPLQAVQGPRGPAWLPL